MKIKNPFQSATDRLLTKEAEHLLYAKASEDMENNILDRGIWTKAFAQANGDEQRQKAIYIELIVDHYKDEIKAGEEFERIMMSQAEKLREKAAIEEAERLKRKEEEDILKREEAERKKLEAYWNSPEGIAFKEKEAAESRVIAFIFLSILVAICSLGIIFGN